MPAAARVRINNRPRHAPSSSSGPPSPGHLPSPHVTHPIERETSQVSLLARVAEIEPSRIGTPQRNSRLLHQIRAKIDVLREASRRVLHSAPDQRPGDLE